VALALLISAAAAGAAGAVGVSASTDTRLIAIGDTLSLNIDIEWESGVEVKPVAAREKLGEFIVRDVREGAVRPEGDGFARRVAILLTIFEVGEHTIPPVPILFTGEGGEPGRVETRPLDVRVESVLGESAEEIRDIKPPLAVSKRWKEIILSYALLIGLAGAAAASVLVSVKKKGEIEMLARKVWDKVTGPVRALVAWLLMLFGLKEKPAPQTSYDIEISGLDIDPGQAALEELARVEALGLVEQGLIKDLYTLVSEVLRRYIERKYGVLAMELPTAFILKAVAGRGVMSACYDGVREVLEECDLVKFARYVPPAEEAATAVPRTREIVRATSETRPAGIDLEA
jgi:hypothetical protein